MSMIATHDKSFASSGAGSAWHRFGAGARRIIRRIQRERMIAVLNGLSPEQLSQLGISRAEIVTYADSLVDGG